MGSTILTRRSVLRTAALATTALAAPFGRAARAAGGVTPSGKMVLAWHTNIAPRWLDPLQHDGSATPDNFLIVVHDALIKNYKKQTLRPSGAGRPFRFCRGRAKRHLPAAREHQVP